LASAGSGARCIVLFALEEEEEKKEKKKKRKNVMLCMVERRLDVRNCDDVCCCLFEPRPREGDVAGCSV
jgi:hypothetical protein